MRKLVPWAVVAALSYLLLHMLRSEQSVYASLRNGAGYQ